MTAKIFIKPIKTENIESFHQALDRVARERKYLNYFQSPPLEEVREFVFSNNKQGSPHLIASFEGEVVGWCDIRRHHFQSHAHRGTLGIGIIPEFRGNGLGARLIQLAIECATEVGFSRIELDVRADNFRAIALSEKAGFVKEGVLRNAVLVDEEFFDVVAMALVHQSE
ncbi:GNAT family N-acetyltransferase [Pelagibius sp. Alg239-R121]|uniref:GNAT family N-acetyltransferase n=1 Tax=Pelagibius sp. Alg239-R121 TaxID=2993448 RepID=UPI0024A77E34|nr:GNAT family protein [Pelagibius sp. Alg239-R121]